MHTAKRTHCRLQGHRSIASQTANSFIRSVPPLCLHGSRQQAATAASTATTSPSVSVTRCSLVAAVAAAEGADGHAPEAEAAAAAASTSGRFTDLELKQLWDSVSRSLLKLGKTGVTETHARSLSELVASHKLVKVQHNGARGDPKAIAAAAAALHEQTEGAIELLQVKGSTMLFGSSSLSNEQLLAVAEAEAASTEVWKTKRAAAAAERRQQRAAAEAKKETSTSRSRRRIGQMITSVAKPSKGPLDKGTLVQEWQQLASSITSEEAAAEGGSSSTQQRTRKAPWKK